MTIQEAVKRFQDIDFSNVVGDFSQDVYFDAVKTILNAITYDEYTLCKMCNELTFGNGEIAITPCILEGMACIMLNEQGEHELGEKVRTKEEWYKNPLIRLNFSNKESIDVLIRNLERLKQFMDVDFDEGALEI